MAFEYFPYSNFHDLNLDWILQQLNKLVTEWREQRKDFDTLQEAFTALKEYVDNVFLDDTIKQAVNDKITELYNNGDLETIIASVINSKYISVYDYGAIGDGVTDDTNAISSAIAYANRSGKTVLFENKTYKMQSIQIAVKTNIDFNNATILITDNAIEGGTVFTLNPENSIDEIALTANDFNNNKAFNQALWGKTFFINTNLLLSNRISNDTPVYHGQLICCAENGEFINTPYYPVVSDTVNYSAQNIQNLVQNNITIKNANFINTSGIYVRFISCKRNNVTLENINIKSTNNTVPNGILIFNQCAYITIKNLFGIDQSNSSTAAYVISLYNVSDVNMDNIVFYDNINGSWGGFGNSRISNVSINNSIINRFDSHYQQFGLININNCTIKKNIVFGTGYGQININNCIITGEIAHRHDSAGYYSGTINVENCTINGQNLISQVYTESINSALLNFEYLYINYRNCISKNTIRCISLNTLNTIMQNKIDIRIINCSFGASTNFINPGAGCNTIIFDNCNINSDSSNYLNAPINNLIINNSVFKTIRVAQGATNLTVVGCTCESIWGDINLLNKFIATNNTFLNNPTLGALTNSYVVNNNTMIGTKTNINQWNNKIG